MRRPVAYDLSRLLIRMTARTPNGIDRIDLNLAKHFLGSPHAQAQGLFLTYSHPLVLSSSSGEAFLDIVEDRWAENVETNQDRVFLELRQVLIDRTDKNCLALKASQRIDFLRISQAIIRLARFAPQLARASLSSVAKNAYFFHTTQAPNARLFRWLHKRPDVNSVFFIHDLLPLHLPQFFTSPNIRMHRDFLEVFVRYAAAAVVNTEIVRDDIADFLETRGRKGIPVFVNPMPAAPIFCREPEFDPKLRSRPYFVVCGTIEPRKNHALLLRIWHRLRLTLQKKTPTLVIIGQRGWSNGSVFRLLDRDMSLRDCVIEVSGLSSAGVRNIVSNARALLMPSYDEGYGLPIVEARMLGHTSHSVRYSSVQRSTGC